MLLKLIYVFIVLVKFLYVSGRLLRNSCSIGLRYVFKYTYMYQTVNLVFPHLGFLSGNIFLIAPFLDHCLLVPFCNFCLVSQGGTDIEHMLMTLTAFLCLQYYN